MHDRRGRGRERTVHPCRFPVFDREVYQSARNPHELFDLQSRCHGSLSLPRKTKLEIETRFIRYTDISGVFQFIEIDEAKTTRSTGLNIRVEYVRISLMDLLLDRRQCGRCWRVQISKKRVWDHAHRFVMRDRRHRVPCSAMDWVVRHPLYYHDLGLARCYDFGDAVVAEEEVGFVDDDDDRLGWAIYSKKSVELFRGMIDRLRCTWIASDHEILIGVAKRKSSLPVFRRFASWIITIRRW